METTDAVNLVPGDVIIMKFGDIVPADVKIFSDDPAKPVDRYAEEVPMQVRPPPAPARAEASCRGLCLRGCRLCCSHAWVCGMHACMHGRHCGRLCSRRRRGPQ